MKDSKMLSTDKITKRSSMETDDYSDVRWNKECVYIQSNDKQQEHGIINLWLPTYTVKVHFIWI